jgi:hypothetical protein
MSMKMDRNPYSRFVIMEMDRDGHFLLGLRCSTQRCFPRHNGSRKKIELQVFPAGIADERISITQYTMSMARLA